MNMTKAVAAIGRVRSSRTAANIVLCTVVLFASSVGRDAISASRPPAMLERVAEHADFRWGDTQSQRVSGLGLHTRHLQSEKQLSESAQVLSQMGVFSGMLIGPGTIQLSGNTAQEHWLAHLQANRTGTIGYVSVLDLSASAQVRQTPETFIPGLPSDTGLIELKYSLASVADNAAQTLRLVDIDYPRLHTYLQRQLRGAGWSSDILFASHTAGASWRKQQQTILLLPEASGKASLLYHSRTPAALAGY